MSKTIYLDHGATTAVDERVLNKMIPYFNISYGNPSSMYGIGRQNKMVIERARQEVAKVINCNPKEIYFTSCGSESDNLALKGIMYANKEKGKHIITSKVEHPAIMNTCATLKRQGFDITYLNVDNKGFVKLDELEKAGAGGSTQFKNLKKAIDDYNNASITDKSAAFDNVYSLAQDLSLEFETTVDTIDSLNDVQFDALDSNFSKLKQNTKFSESEVNELTLTWSNAGEQLSKGLLDKVTETVDNDLTVDTSVKDLVTGATNESNTGDKSKGNAVGTRLTAGVTSAINANTSVKSATSSLVTTATSDSNTGASAKAKATGKLIGTGLGDGAKAKSEYLKGALRNLATLVSNDADIKWTDKAKAAGGFIIDGIQAGLEAKEKMEY